MGYLGSKAASGAYQAIISSMPPHDTYIETHIGSGAIMFRKPKAARSIGIDIDSAVINNLYKTADKEIELHNCDAVTFLRNFEYKAAGRVLIYSDPPYLHSTRTSRTRYTHEYTVDDHKNLVATLLELAKPEIMVMLSGYPSDLYNELLPRWRVIEFQVMTRGGVRTEKLWMSFNSASYHWVTHAGIDFTDRQRIKRKAQRWADNYKALPQGERLAVLAALLDCK